MRVMARSRRTIATLATLTWLSAPALAASPTLSRATEEPAPHHAIAMHGTPALPADFDHFPYADPNAPKGGRLTFGLLGAFDSLNPLIVNGLPLEQIRNYVLESLLTRGYDEPFTLYGLLARSVETDDARSYVTFTLDPAACFSDGTPVTAADVIFSWQLLRDKGRPNHRSYYSKVAKAEAVGEHGVRFTFTDTGDRELPLILGLMPVLSKRATNPETFERTSFTAPLGSGPYTVASVDAGRSVTLKRNPAYWGRDLPVNRGFWNFDEVRFDFYRDANSHFEAFKRGLYDLRAETDPGRWEEGYNGPALRAGRIVKETFKTGLPKGMAGFVFNTRRPIFADVRVREAIGMLFDARWANHNFFSDQYRRTASYFDGSELSAHGRAADATERALLAPFANAVRPDILDGAWSPPSANRGDRARLREAIDLLAKAGWEVQDTQLRERATGRPFAFEILITNREQERLALAFASDLKRAGIVATVRIVDAAQYDRRRQTFDFDMIENDWPASLSPGNEQNFYWGSAAADAEGSRNYMGAKNPAIDAMIHAMLAARERPRFVSTVRALDRALLSGFYVVPLFHLPDQWVARSSRVAHPRMTSLYGYLPETWWRAPGAR
jgi:peptide/nickel transport system substrate-binding protein